MDKNTVVKRITKNLVQFGYEGLTEEHVAKAYDNVMAGEQPKGIISMMPKSMLEEAGLL